MEIVGYLMYGDDVESQITLNLPTGKASTEVAIYTTLFILITRYALMLTPVANGIETRLSENYKNWTPVRLLIRMHSFLLPCQFYLTISSSYQNWSYNEVGIIGIIIFVTVAGIFETYSSIAELVDDV
ncbi:hypothetical protein ACSBR2_017401 [Camellia fascicularis]